MKKIHDFLERQKAREMERKAARKAHWQSISRLRKVAYYGVNALAITILIVGILTKTIHTTFFAAFIVLCVLPLIVRGRRWRTNFVVGIACSPPIVLMIALALGGYTMGMNYDDALRDQEIMRTHSDEVARDAAEFLADYRAGTVQEIAHQRPDHYALELGGSDRAGYKGARRIAELIHLSAPAGLDTTAIMPLAEVLYADHTVILYDQAIAKRGFEEQDAALEAQFGVPAHDIPLEDRAAAMPDFKGIYAITCMFKNDGEILLATGLPTGYHTDLRKLPAAEPFIEVCRSEARAKAEPEKSALSIITQALH